MTTFFRLLPLGIFLILVGYAGFLTLKLNDLTKDRDRLVVEIINIRAGQALTDQLRKDNAILDRDQNDIRNDLRDAQGYSDPLAPDVRRVLERLR